ncbi:acetyl-CoA hydrolase/transferase C-terminal domain-containing protein [Desulfopila aestuarii]|uniref:Acetyl-CoA hydrolase/transferase C-terminal domain-containing protein n=1 Tax=Desulfopila aestuarii DSM 18488 TaxID=1121416 RepID=A0A1M7Y3A0_9BACT|nr:acetyl-CoA hydrolase/transferase C-terminal domain-containing protein [Desulfopila aestuarii]SHO46384.1 Acetyl-CoA hydrolase/transferase C-terminal domain-containing protein [Desulfopila aestuarii DSM 18488]
MNGKTGVIYSDVKKSVDDVLDYMGNEINFAMTLALGKPILFINELYRRAKEDSTIKLNIVTALALERPRMKNDIEKRFMGPLVDRIFKGTPEFDYMHDFRTGKLPKNVEIYEFFNKAGGYMETPEAQRNHLNSNYTHVVRDAIDFGCNVFGQLISCREINGKTMYSMGCNTDICIEAIKEMHKMRAQGRKVAIIGEVNRQLPFMYGDAVFDGNHYDMLLHGPEFNYPLFGPPKESVSLRDHAIGLHVSTLVKDGGTLQVGIGALGDAIAASLNMRQNENEAYNKVLKATGIIDKYSHLINKIGGTGRFDQGLYGSSEMFVDAFFQLYKSGVLKRKVYDSIPIMKLINAGKLSSNKIPADIIELLLDIEGIHSVLTAKDFNMLSKYGILKEGLEFKDGYIVDGSTRFSGDFRHPENVAAIKTLLGRELKHGKVILGAFFIGPRAFYDALNSMSEEERMQFGMSGVEKVNQLYGNEELRSLQRKEGRFVNAGMMANVFGAITSDKLECGRVVSGIGGQYNFVSMAHALPDGRLVMMIRSTRFACKKVKSNIVYTYGHTSIPKHLRDIIVTEYGIADVRGKPDSKIIEEILKITDSRFQDDLIKEAKLHGKLAPDFELAPEYKQNYPKKLEMMLKEFQADGHFAPFPFGTDFTADEIVIGGSLKALAAKKKPAIVKGLIKELFRPIPHHAKPYLKRMELDKPKTGKEKIMRKVVLSAMRANGKI